MVYLQGFSWLLSPRRTSPEWLWPVALGKKKISVCMSRDGFPYSEAVTKTRLLTSMTLRCKDFFLSEAQLWCRDFSLLEANSAAGNPQLACPPLEGGICRYANGISPIQKSCHIPIGPLPRLSRTFRKLVSTPQRQPVPNKSAIKQHKQDYYNNFHFHTCTKNYSEYLYYKSSQFIWLHLTNNIISHHISV